MAADKILIIGNGPSATKYKLGKEIDKFPLVVRFNSYRIEGYEDYVGTKTDMWVTCDIFPKWHKDYKEVYLCSFDRKPENKLFLKLKERYPEAKMFPEEAWQETVKEMGFNAPSSGAVAVTHLMKKYKVYLYGFDFFQKDIHHYGDSVSMGSNHNKNFELAYFNKLIESGNVVMFNNYSILHDADKAYGSGGNWHRPNILKVANEHGCKSILDYGCGKGELVKLLGKGIPTDGYDPYCGYIKTVPQYDMVVTTDFLEHMEDLNEVKRIVEYKPKVMYHAVSNRIASRILPDGTNAHKIVENQNWWKNRLVELFPEYEIVSMEHNDNQNFTMYVMEVLDG